MKSQVLLTVWCNISGEAAGEIWHWSLSGVKGLLPLDMYRTETAAFRVLILINLILTKQDADAEMKELQREIRESTVASGG